jgi:hypothetical protein
LAFNISFIPREENLKADSLALVAITFRPPIGQNIKYQVEIRHRTTILDNIKHWQVFSDDLELQIFLHTVDEFSNISIDQESQEGEKNEVENQQTSHLLKTIVGHDIVEMKTNHIPRGLAPLEKLFDNNDFSIGATMKNQEEEITDWSIGTPENPKIIKFPKELATE